MQVLFNVAETASQMKALIDSGDHKGAAARLGGLSVWLLAECGGGGQIYLDAKELAKALGCTVEVDIARD